MGGGGGHRLSYYLHKIICFTLLTLFCRRKCHKNNFPFAQYAAGSTDKQNSERICDLGYQAPPF